MEIKTILTQPLQRLKTSVKPYLLSLSLVLSGMVTSTAYAEDPFAKTQDLAQQGITKVQGISIIIFWLCGCCHRFGLWLWWSRDKSRH